jgi:hypothetical protein
MNGRVLIALWMKSIKTRTLKGGAIRTKPVVRPPSTPFDPSTPLRAGFAQDRLRSGQALLRTGFDWLRAGFAHQNPARAKAEAGGFQVGGTHPS